MKRFLSTIPAWLWIVAPCFGATVNTSMLDLQDFTTNGVPPASIGVHLNNTQLSHTGAGITITDVTGVTGTGGAAILGTLTTNGANATAGSLVKFGNRLTNTVDAASADVQATLGQVYQSTNANLTGWASVPATSAGVQGVLGQVYQATNTVLTHYAGTDTNAILAAIGGVAKVGDTMTGALTIQQGAATSLTISNTASQVGLAVNGFSGQTANVATIGSGGTNGLTVNKDGYTIATALGVGVTPSTTYPFQVSGTSLLDTIRPRQTTLFIGTSTDPVHFDSTVPIAFGVDNVSAGSGVIRGGNGVGTDKNGGSLTLEGGQSTGTGRGGGVVMRTSATLTTGSSANAYQDRARYVPKYIDLTDNTATTLFTVSLPATNVIGIQFVCTVQASDGTDFQSLTTPVTVDAVAKTTTITTVVAPTAAQTAVAASSAATLSVTYTVVDAGSNVLAVKATADTSFGSPTYLRAKIVMTAINGIGAGWSITEI